MPHTEPGSVDATILRLPTYEDLRARGVFSTEVEKLRAENRELRSRLEARRDALELVKAAIRLLERT